MTGPDIKNRLLKRLGQDPAEPRYYNAGHAYAALNEAQQLFALMTLCLEAEVYLQVSPSQFEYDMSFPAPNWLVCLAVRRSVDGVKVQPSTLGEMAALNPIWQATQASSAPNRYAVAGFWKVFFTPQPSSTATVIITYARAPQAIGMVGVDGIVSGPEIPEEYQPSLIDYAQVLLRLNQGAQLLAADLPLLTKFFDAAKRCASYIRARSLDQRYDVLPPEIKMPDFSRVLHGKRKAAPLLEKETA